MLTKQNSMVVGANLFGCVNLALICCVLGLVDTRGGATKKTTNYAGDVTNNRAGDVVTNNITVTFDVDDAEQVGAGHQALAGAGGLGAAELVLLGSLAHLY